jgi:hypothetical protein
MFYVTASHLLLITDEWTLKSWNSLIYKKDLFFLLNFDIISHWLQIKYREKCVLMYIHVYIWTHEHPFSEAKFRITGLTWHDKLQHTKKNSKQEKAFTWKKYLVTERLLNQIQETAKPETFHWFFWQHYWEFLWKYWEFTWSHYKPSSLSQRRHWNRTTSQASVTSAAFIYSSFSTSSAPCCVSFFVKVLSCSPTLYCHSMVREKYCFDFQWGPMIFCLARLRKLATDDMLHWYLMQFHIADMAEKVVNQIIAHSALTVLAWLYYIVIISYM